MSSLTMLLPARFQQMALSTSRLRRSPEPSTPLCEVVLTPSKIAALKLDSKQAEHSWKQFSSAEDCQRAFEEELTEMQSQVQQIVLPKQYRHDSDPWSSSTNSTSTSASRQSSVTSVSGDEDATSCSGSLHQANSRIGSSWFNSTQSLHELLHKKETGLSFNPAMSSLHPTVQIGGHTAVVPDTFAQLQPTRSMDREEQSYLSTLEHVSSDARVDADGLRIKGKGQLTTIPNISWELVEEQDVKTLCQAFDDSHHGWTSTDAPGLSTPLLSEKIGPSMDRLTTASRPGSSHDVLSMNKEKDPGYETPSSAQVPKLELGPSLSQRFREQTRASIALFEQRLIQNHKRLAENVKRYSDEDNARRQKKERFEAEAQHRRGREDFLAALALEKDWHAQDTEECRLAEERARMRECAVCGDEMDKEKFPVKTVTTKCQHESTTCSTCLDSWIASALNDNGIDGIKCPECPVKLDYQDVQTAASAVTFEAYDKATTMQALSSLPDFAWCLAASCKSGQLNTDNSNYMECASCGYKQCLQHKIPWHSGETCEKYEFRTSGAQAKEEEAKTLAMLDSMSKLCPGPNCGWRIQKTDGCDHITCRKCRFEFCWQCLASHVEIRRVGNTAHKPDCKFHSTNLDLAWPFNRH